LRLAGDDLINEGTGKAVEIPGRDGMLQARAGGGPREIGLSSSGARSSPSLNSGSRRSALASLPSSSAQAIG
jgi:hypothetical protein